MTIVTIIASCIITFTTGVVGWEIGRDMIYAWEGGEA